jgi:hypothetical protein
MGFNYLVYRQLSANVMTVTMILFAHTTILWATCCLTCTYFKQIVKPFLTHFTTVCTIYLIWKWGSQRDWPVNRGCLFLHGSWSHLWYIQRSVYAHSLICISDGTYEIDYCSLFSVISYKSLYNDSLDKLSYIFVVIITEGNLKCTFIT